MPRVRNIYEQWPVIGSSYARRKLIDAFVRKYLDKSGNPGPEDSAADDSPEAWKAMELIVKRVERKGRLSDQEFLNLLRKAEPKYGWKPGELIRVLGSRRGLTSEQIEEAANGAAVDPININRTRWRYEWRLAWQQDQERSKERKAAARRKERALERMADAERQKLSAAYFRRIGRKGATHDEIVEQAHPLEPICGVYFLVKEKRVVYVGQSVNIVARLATHMGTKDFDSTCYMVARPEELDFIESFYIYMLSPALNGPAPMKLGRFLSVMAPAEQEG